jgi:hypothetical protein
MSFPWPLGRELHMVRGIPCLRDGPSKDSILHGMAKLSGRPERNTYLSPVLCTLYFLDRLHQSILCDNANITTREAY